MTPTWGVEKAPDGGLRVFVDVSEHECQVAGVDPSAAPAPSEPPSGDLDTDEPLAPPPNEAA